jgi:hypothetical protein
MRLSKLQRYILEKTLESKNAWQTKESFYQYYPKEEIVKNSKTINESVFHSLELMVANDLLVAYGHQTAKKWYIHRIHLTAHGKKLAKDLLKRKQKRLPIK